MKYKITIDCAAYYEGEVEIPTNLTVDEAYSYVKERLHEIPVDWLTKMEGSENIDKELFEYELLTQQKER